jgi:hypothetical protein
LFIGRSDNTLNSTTLTPGPNVLITNGSGQITIEATIAQIDGGSASSVYTPAQVVDCGGA